MAIKRDDDVDYSKSTNAFPMPAEPTTVFEAPTDVDYSKSTNAFPMYDDPEQARAAAAAKGVTVVTDAGTPESTGAFSTPGPISIGEDGAVAAQREELGLSADPSGDSDSGYEARPSTIAVPGADGVDRTADEATDDAATELAAADAGSEETPVPDPKPAGTKTVKTAQTKVVKPPAAPAGDAQTTATTK